MKKAAVLLAAWVCFALPATAHTVGETAKTTKEQRQVGDYQNLKVDGPFKVTLVGGDAGTLTLKGETEMLSLITTTVSNGTLDISLAEGRELPATQKVEIEVPFKLLNRIDLKGSGSIDVNKTIKNKVKVTLDGCGSISFRADTSDVETCLLGQGEINVKGVAKNFTCKIIGCGHITGYQLDADNVTACISGSGTIQTACNKKLTGRINGSGNIVFSGNPEAKDLRRSGQGEFTML